MRFCALLSCSVPCTHEVGKPSFSCIAGALHVRAVAKLYGVPVILHTDHAQKSWLPWIDGLMEANEEYFKQHGEPLFSSHMLDLSEEPLEENIAICKKYLERMAKVNVALEFGAVVCACVCLGVAPLRSGRALTSLHRHLHTAPNCTHTHMRACHCPPHNRHQ